MPPDPRRGLAVLLAASLRWRVGYWRFFCGLGLVLVVDSLQGADAPSLPDEQPVRFGAADAFYPYQYRDHDGQLKGFANDIADAVARVSSVPMRRIGLPISAAPDALQSGQVDVLQFLGETEERREWADFSVPIVRFETAVVVRKGERQIQRLADLKGHRVAAGARGTVGYRYLADAQPHVIPVYAVSTEELLRLVAEARVDAAVLSRLTAVANIDRLGLRNLTMLREAIPGDTYDVRYCFAVRKGDARLLARLNEGLAIIHRSGEFDEIYRRWFGRYEGRTFSALELVSWVAAALALACGAVSWGLIRQRTLRHRLARQATELAEQRSLLAALYDRHPLATVILELSPAGPLWVMSANGQAARLFGFSTARPLPERLSALSLSMRGSSEFLEDAARRWRALSEPSQWEAKLPDGPRLLEAALVPLGRSEHGLPRICVLCNDVTERRFVEHELAHSRRLRALGELVGGIAHEFNNLLTPIIMTTSQARLQHTLPADTQADFAIVDNAARRAAELTKRLLTFGRTGDDQPQPVAIAEAINNCFALLRPTVDRRLQWSLDAPTSLPPLVINPTDLNQVIFNLVINARDTLLEKLSQPHDGNWTPKLEVTLEELPGDALIPPRRRAVTESGDSSHPFGGATLSGWVRINVRDNGLGIPPEITERIFEPFFTTKEIGQGTGLGLATVWHLVTECGGHIQVDSKLGEGTQFIISLPRWGETARPSTVRPDQAARRGNTRPLRILLAEDDLLVTRAAIAVLERARHTVTHCADGSDAWSRLEASGAQFDVLLLDLNMPRLNGTDLIRRIRRGVFSGAIAVMSGRFTDEERQNLVELNVDRIISKPFTASDLLDVVRELGAKRKD